MEKKMSSGSNRTAKKRQRALRASKTTGKPGFNPEESPLTWLARRRNKDGSPMLSEAQAAAGERLRADFWLGQMTPRTTVNWDFARGVNHGRRAAPRTGLDHGERTVAARERVRRALAAVGPELSGILVDVCCHLMTLEATERAHSWPQRSAKLVLGLALDRLARHYGLSGHENGASPTGPARIQHWGAKDYRPQQRLPAQDNGAE